MRSHLFWAASLAALATAAPLHAQYAGPSRFQITPYAGYLKSGAMVDGPFGTALRNGGAPVYGGEMSLGLTRGLALIGNVAYSQPGLEVGAPILGGLQVARSSVLLYDAGVRLSLPVSEGGLPFTPFVQGGAGAMRQSFEIGPVTARSTNFAYNVGGGVDVDLSPRLGLRLMAKDYIGKFDAQEAALIGADTRTTHNWAFSAGVRLGL
ncbi:MAG TPA: outer membrane beta-barrel protein [Gemmatimonadales bacterium]|nr:outer membrane beta-barrel protein [Gemmatimonadales bacterium]